MRDMRRTPATTVDPDEPMTGEATTKARLATGERLRRKAEDAGRWTARDGAAMRAEAIANPLPEPTRIFIDHREPEALKRCFRGIPNLIVEEASLEAGDIILPGKLVIERKSVEDFVLSVNGEGHRIYAQLERMGREDGVKVLILEGDWREARNITLNQMTAMMAAIAVRYRITRQETLAPEHTAYFVLKMVRYALFGPGHDVDLRGAAPQDPADASIFLMEGLPKVSSTLARSLKETFGSMHGLANATLREIENAPGIGRVKARGIFEAIHHGNADISEKAARRSKNNSRRQARFYAPIDATMRARINRSGLEEGTRLTSSCKAAVEAGDGTVVGIIHRHFEDFEFERIAEDAWRTTRAIAAKDVAIERYAKDATTPLPVDMPLPDRFLRQTVGAAAILGADDDGTAPPPEEA